jgi:tetratricopeptide (TPR) repeat protein
VVHVVLVCAGLLAGQTADKAQLPAESKTYEALKAKAGRNPAAQVKLALWCEAHGLGAERMKHLAMAVLVDPKNAAARGLLGLFESSGRWETLERARERLSADSARSANLAEYERRRAKLTADEIRSHQAQDRLEREGKYEPASSARLKDNRRLAQAHVSLGLWCESVGLAPEATAHFTVAIHFDPYRDSTWKRLGYVKRDGRWTSPQQAAIQDRDDREQVRADHEWEPLLKKWKSWLLDKKKAPEAERLLATVTDRQALPSILRVFPAGGSEAAQARRVRLVGQIDDPSSSRAIAAQAVSTRFLSVRRDAIELLKGRPDRDYAADLVERIHGAVRYEVQPVSQTYSRGALAIDAPRFRMFRTYDVPAAFQLASSFRGYVGYDPNGLPIVVSGRELQRMQMDSGSPTAVAADLRGLEARTAALLSMAAEATRLQMAADIEVIETVNQQARIDNANIVPVLESAAGAPASLGDDEDAWHTWWYDKLGYSYQASPKPTFAQDATPSYQAPYIRTCFAAGTPVETLSGPRPIEAIEAGDRVLSQDAATGALSFQPVVFVHRNPPDKTLRINLSDGESVVCSIYHRFWRANLGWAQARELKPGDTLRDFGGIVHVDNIGTDTIQPLYNLDIATSGTFFAGRSKLLVHDNTLPDHRLVPFDALPTP